MKWRGSQLFLALLLAVGPCPASAAPGDNIGINAARRIADSVDQAVNTLKEMQAKFGVDLHFVIESLQAMEKQAFDRIDTITRDRLQEVEKLVSETMSKVRDLEDDAFKQVNVLVLCTPQILSNAIETSISNIKVLSFITLNYKSPTDLSPYGQYIAARTEILNGLNKITPDATAEGVFFAYGEISRLAILAQCHAKGTNTGLELVQQSQDFSDLQAPWYQIMRGK
jgi:hypothetical protein